MAWRLAYKIWIESLDGKFHDGKEWFLKVQCSDKNLVLGINMDMF
jgi:hypothetical protein